MQYQHRKLEYPGIGERAPDDFTQEIGRLKGKTALINRRAEHADCRKVRVSKVDPASNAN